MIRLDAEVRQAISASSAREAGFYTPAFQLVPGWVVRGALAGAWMRMFGRPQPGSARRSEFLDLFEGGVRFGALLPDGATIEPLSTAVCKYPKGEECEGELVDLVASPDTDHCPRCGGPMEPLKGALRGGSVTARARVALEPEERAKDGSLFTREEIPAGVQMWGLVDGHHPWLASLSQASVWFGGRRSTSGLAEVTASATPPPSAAATGDRLVVRCASPLISLDRFARPMLEPDKAELAEVLGVAAGSIELERRFARPVTVGGWHLASGMPKPRELAAAAGSTFVYRVPGITAAGRQLLATKGLGMRQREGFGWIEVDPEPWVPPALVRVKGTEVRRLSVDALLDLDAADRRWAVGFVRQRLEELESRSTPRTSPVTGTARFVLLNRTQQEQLGAALEETDRAVLRRFIDTLLEGQ